MLNISFLICWSLAMGMLPQSGYINRLGLSVNRNVIEIKSDGSNVYEIAQYFLGQNDTKSSYHQEKMPSLVTIDDGIAAFAEKKIIGRRAWEIKIDSIRFEIKYNRPMPESERYKYKSAELLIDSATGNLIEVTLLSMGVDDSEISERDRIIHGQFDRGDAFHGFPLTFPKIGLIDAVEKCMYYPSVAMEIKCSYIMYSHNGEDPRPTWVITMLGLPQQETPLGLVTDNMKCFIDAIDGHGYPAVSITYPPESDSTK